MLRSYKLAFSPVGDGVRGDYLSPPPLIWTSMRNEHGSSGDRLPGDHSDPPADRQSLFGTSGVRGRVGEAVTADFADAVARAVAVNADRAVVGRDARDSGRSLVAALAGLDETLASDGRPVACQNAWEDSTGRFGHTAATFLEAYSELARHGDGLGAGALDAEALDANALHSDLPDDLAAHAGAQAERVFDALDDLWVPDRGCYALRETDQGDIDDRLDSSTLALASAHRSFDAVREIDDDRLDRLVTHVESVVNGLARETDGVSGLIRYEGDGWRRAGQRSEKVWTVSTAWGANACAELAVLLDDHDDPRADEMFARARELLARVSPGGSLCAPTGYLPEQVFDDGTSDSATPLGWPHAIRLATVALLADADRLSPSPAVAD
ncbi:hypothetical protein GCM10028858_22030 [Halorubrum pallidum]